MISRFRRLIDITQPAVIDPQSIDFHLEGRFVAVYSRRFSRFRDDFFCRCFGRVVDIIRNYVIQTQFLDLNLCPFSGVFDRSIGGENSLPDREFISLRDRFEVVDPDLLQL